MKNIKSKRTKYIDLWNKFVDNLKCEVCQNLQFQYVLSSVSPPFLLSLSDI